MMNGSDGQYLTCPDGNMVLGICTSGMYADCGGGAFTRMNCCDGKCRELKSRPVARGSVD